MPQTGIHTDSFQLMQRPVKFRLLGSAPLRIRSLRGGKVAVGAGQVYII